MTLPSPVQGKSAEQSALQVSGLTLYYSHRTRCSRTGFFWFQIHVPLFRPVSRPAFPALKQIEIIDTICLWAQGNSENWSAACRPQNRSIRMKASIETSIMEVSKWKHSIWKHSNESIQMTPNRYPDLPCAFQTTKAVFCTKGFVLLMKLFFDYLFDNILFILHKLKTGNSPAFLYE